MQKNTLLELQKLGARIQHSGDDVIAVRFVGPRFGDDALVDLTDCAKLKHLELIDTQVSDKGALVIARLKSLESLDFEGSRITDQGMSSFTRLAKLRHVVCSRVVTNAAFKALSSWPMLRSICVRDSRVTDLGLREIRALPQLRQLDLNGCSITDIGLKHIANCVSLQELNLTNTEVTDEGLGYLSQLTQLHSLYVRGTDVTFSGVVDLVTERQQRGFVVALQMLGLVALDEQQPVRLDLGRTKLRDEHL